MTINYYLSENKIENSNGYDNRENEIKLGLAWKNNLQKLTGEFQI